MTQIFFGGYVLAWLRAFVFTQLVEAPLYRRVLGVSWAKALLASTITHPFVWFFFPWVCGRLHTGYRIQVVVSELFAWWVEAAFFRLTARVAWPRAVGVSLLVNAASVVLGLLSRHFFGTP